MRIYIKAMSMELQAVKDELTSKSKPMVKHLIKVLLYPNCYPYNHWKGEIYDSINDVDRLKGKNKWPKQTQIFKWISVHNDMIETYIPVIEEDEAEFTPRDISVAEIEDAIVQYQSWLASELSAEGVILRSAAYAKIDEIVESAM